MSAVKPMNLLYIFSDQHSKFAIGSYGNSYVHTPNLDRLANMGVSFDTAYCNCPICVPSRASMAIGDYGSRANYWDNAHGYAGEAPSWAARLHEQGHQITTIGKLHFKGDLPETGFVDQRIPLNLRGDIGDVFGSVRNELVTRTQWNDLLLGAKPGESDYTGYDRKTTELACDFFRQEAKTTEKPWALMLGYCSPHFPLICPQEFWELYEPEREKLPFPAQYGREERPHHPIVDSFRRYGGTENMTEDQVYRALHAYYGLCSFLDCQIGIVLDALEKEGLMENTRIIYSTDHGDTLGDHAVFFKHTMYEGSVAIPMIMAGPDIPKGKRLDTPVSLVDTFPTVLECVGAHKNPEDAKLPGTSLLPIAKGESDPRRTVFAEYHACGIHTGMYMVRVGDYKYVYYVGFRPQLFNLKRDPGELTDLAENPAYKDVLKHCDDELRKIVDPEGDNARAKAAQKKLLDRYGGERHIMEHETPWLYSPVPKQLEREDSPLKEQAKHGGVTY